MRVQVWNDGECFYLQCGTGMQRIAWIARVAAQRFGSGGIWCPPEKEVGRPREYIPGRVFSYPDDEELDTEATIASLLEVASNPDLELSFSVELRDKPAQGLPSLAAKGSEDSIVPPKNSKAAVSYQVTQSESGKIIKRTPAPVPAVHQGYKFFDVMDNIDIRDITEGADEMIKQAVRNVISNNFAPLVDIFLHYAKPPTVGGTDQQVESAELTISMKSLATLVRTCRLSSETCSFFEIQRASVQPHLLLPNSEEEWSLGVYEAEYKLHEFIEALIRVAHLKNYGLSALCDQVNKLIHTQVLPYATGDDEDHIRELTQKSSVQMIFFHQKNGLRRFFTKRMRLDRQNARSISLGEFISCLKNSDQVDEELTPAAVKEIWLATLSFDVAPDMVTEDDNHLEISLSEFEEIITRCVLQKSKVAEENLPQQTDLFIKKFLRQNL